MLDPRLVGFDSHAGGKGSVYGHYYIPLVLGRSREPGSHTEERTCHESGGLSEDQGDGGSFDSFSLVWVEQDR